MSKNYVFINSNIFNPSQMSNINFIRENIFFSQVKLYVCEVSLLSVTLCPLLFAAIVQQILAEK